MSETIQNNHQSEVTQADLVWDERNRSNEYLNSLNDEELEAEIRLEIRAKIEAGIAEFKTEGEIIGGVHDDMLVKTLTHRFDGNYVKPRYLNRVNELQIIEEELPFYSHLFKEVEKLVDFVVEEKISYQDAPITYDDKENALETNKSSDSAKKYARALLRLEKEVGEERVDSTAQRIHQQFLEAMNKLGYEDVNPYSKSLSWVYWDIGKQTSFNENQASFDTTSGIYYDGQPVAPHDATEREGMIETRKEREILRRHIGWEVFHRSEGFSIPKASRLLEVYKHTEDEVKQYIEDNNKRGELHSWQYVQLGEKVQSLIGAIEFSDEYTARIKAS